MTRKGWRGLVVLWACAGHWGNAIAGGEMIEKVATRGEQEAGGKAGRSASAANLSEIFAEGEAALRRGELDAAEAAFRKVLAADAKAGAAYANLGVIAMRRKQWKRALELLQKGERLEPKMTGIRLNIGLAKYRSGDYAGAVAPLETVMREQPDSKQARYLLGLCEVFTERYGEAVGVLEPLWEEQSSDFMYLYVLGIAAHGAGLKDLDEKALNRLVEVGGDAPEFHLILGKAYLNREEPEKAVVELERAAAGNAALPFAHFSLGVAYARMDKPAEAEAELRKDLEVEPDLADTYEQLGNLNLRAGKNEEAEKFFGEALKRNGRSAASFFGLAKIYFQAGKYGAALRAADAALRLAPDAQGVHFVRGQALARLGRREEAQTEFAKAKKILNSELGKRRETLEDGRIPNPELAQPPQ